MRARSTAEAPALLCALALSSAALGGCGAQRPCACEGSSLRASAFVAGERQDLFLDRAPTLFRVVTAPEFTLQVEAAGDYQIDALGTLDPALTLFEGERLIASDDDGGEGDNARLVVTLPPGRYTVRVQERQGRAMVVQLQARRLPAVEQPGALAPGQRIEVRVASGDEAPRRAVSEPALVITEAGLYQLDAVSPGLDAELALLRDGVELARDSDSGEDLNARLLARLEPGRYGLRVWEHGQNAAVIVLSAELARGAAVDLQPALEPVGALSIDQPLTVEVEPASELLAGTRALAFAVTEAAIYQFDATAEEGQDPELSLVEGGVELGRDSDGGEGFGARIVRHLPPGEYQLRVWEYQQRGARITLRASRP